MQNHVLLKTIEVGLYLRIMDREFFMKDKFRVNKVEPSVLINAVIWMGKIVFVVYDKVADSPMNIAQFKSKIHKI